MTHNLLTAHQRGLMRRCAWAAKEQMIATEQGRDARALEAMHAEAYANAERELGWGLAQEARAEGFALATAYLVLVARNA